MPGSLIVTGTSSGEAVGTRTFGPLTISGTATVGETLVVPLASGDNTFTVPAGAVAALVVPPPAGGAALKVRTSANSSDTGLPVSPSLPMVFPFAAAPPTSLIVNAASAVTGFSIAFI